MTSFGSPGPLADPGEELAHLHYVEQFLEQERRALLESFLSPAAP